jgi:hypothetical protein
MVTSNQPFEQWAEVFGSERPTGTFLNRLIHRCHILEVNGESYRLRQAKELSKRRPPQKQFLNQEQLQNLGKEVLDNSKVSNLFMNQVAHFTFDA